MCNANKLPLFGGVFTTPLQLGSYSVPFDVHLPRECKCPLEKVMPGQGHLKVKVPTQGLHAALICDRIS